MARYKPPPPPRDAGRFFTSEGEYWHNAILTGFGISWYAYAEGYKAAADATIDGVARDRTTRDIVVFPVVYLYRQYLELTLKLMISDAEEIADIENPPPIGHHLDHLWSRCRTALNAVFAMLDNYSVDITVIGDCIKQFHEVDPTSQAFRYPTDRAGNPIEHVATQINLRQLRVEMDNAALVIDTLIAGLSAYVDLHREMLGDGTQ